MHKLPNNPNKNRPKHKPQQEKQADTQRRKPLQDTTLEDKQTGTTSEEARNRDCEEPAPSTPQEVVHRRTPTRSHTRE